MRYIQSYKLLSSSLTYWGFKNTLSIWVKKQIKATYVGIILSCLDNWTDRLFVRFWRWNFYIYLLTVLHQNIKITPKERKSPNDKVQMEPYNS